jgi:hypothetical protein
MGENKIPVAVNEAVKIKYTNPKQSAVMRNNRPSPIDTP